MADELFREKAPGIMRKLMEDFGLSVEESAAILGNIGGETGGFVHLQELNPTVKGSRGGWGWCQWTAGRRKQFESYAKRNHLDPSADDTNYKFLWNELSGKIGDEGGALEKLRNATGIEAKVIAFEKAFLRAGVKHYPERIRYARVAVEAFNGPPPVHESWFWRLLRYLFGK